MNRDILPEWFI